MTRLKKLAPVVKHVENREQSALQAVAQSQQQVQFHTQRLEQLQAYKEEYVQRTEQPGQSMNALALREFHRFLDQLDETIRQQQQVVSLAKRELEIKHQKWQLTHSRSKAMHKVIDHIHESELKQIEKQEQMLNDEIAQRSPNRDR